MSSTVVRQLVIKDIYVNRGILWGAVLVGTLGLALASLGPNGYAFGSILYLTALIATAMFLAMYGVMQERKDRSDLFVLSLPLSGADYARAKVLGVVLSFMIPWALLTAGAVVVVATSATISHGMVAFTLLISVYVLAAFCVLIAIVLLVRSDAIAVAGVVLTNFSITAFMFAITLVPAVSASMRAPAVVWNGSLLIAFVCVALVGIGAVS